MASMSGATASAFSCRPSSYDVFISFRGADTRRNFVSLLYKALIRDGIHAFIDSEQLREGEEICPSLVRAIRGSKISIPIFSKRYADSKYCLFELAQIWECHLSEGQTVLPIFIDVEPHHVRYQTKSFQGPFQKHPRECEFAVIESWKNALSGAANLTGWTLKGDATIEQQSNIAELVVQRILRELGSTPLDERQHLIGMDSHVDRLLHLLHIGSDDVQFVGICGMGGLGKTTIAEVVYNRIFKSFNGSSFLKDVSEEASQGNKGLVSLQRQLLRDIFKRDYDISIVSRGSKLIAGRLHRENILLVLDNVDDNEQLDALAGGLHWFGQGSKVIITTRDDHILNALKIKFAQDIQIYMPSELSFENSIQLFSLHAFSMNEPPENYKQLSYEIIRCAEGLPLTLEVLGSFLSDKNEEEWKDTLERLKDTFDDKVVEKSIRNYDDKVIGKLMLSFEKLGDPEKTIFLDIACYFSGWKKEAAVSIWEACKLCPRLAIKELIQKHLLRIDANGCIKMHGQLRYMGRRIVWKESFGDLAKRSRLWSQDEILKVLEKHLGTQMVEGILLDDNFESEAKDSLCYEDFMKMPKLRFLKVDENLNGAFFHLPSRLRWFYWRDCPLEFLPVNFYHEELVYLALKAGRFKEAWKNGPQNKIKRFQKLKVLDLEGCLNFSMSHNFFSWFPHLERLNLYGCHSLVELPDSICRMARLKSLILNECISFSKLPASISDLKHLVQLFLCWTRIEELPDGVGQLEKLEELEVTNCHELVKLPTSMGRMRSLHHFDMEGTNIFKLPDDFSMLSSLEVLKIGMSMCILETERRPPPASISLSNFFLLQELNLSGYMRFEFLPDLSHLERLKELVLFACQGLRYIVKLPSNLIHLCCGDCESLIKLPNLSNLKNLRKLDITNCKNLEEIHGLEGTKSLEDLKASNCFKLTELSDLSKLKSLRKLHIEYCMNLKDIQGLQETESLEELEARDCRRLTELPDVSKLKRLRKLDITNCRNLGRVHGLEGAESLEDLKASNCLKLTELPDLSKLKRLRKLDITNCKNLEKIHSLEGTESLESLYAWGCYKLTETRRSIHGKGRLLDDVGEDQGSKSIADDEIYYVSPILSVVFAFTLGERLEQVKLQAGELVTIILLISVSIRREEKWTRCFLSIRIEDIKFTDMDIIYIHHFNGFGYPLQTKDAIKELKIATGEIFRHSDPHHYHIGRVCKLKFWKLLFEKKESDQQMPNQQSSGILVADFFRWSHADNDEEGALRARL